MRFDLDKVFGIHEHGIRVRAQRAEILASNMANADTPDYKARDIDFQQALKQVEAGMHDSKTSANQMKTTHALHMPKASGAGNDGFELLYRNPLQPSVDGNTVDSQHEKAQFMQNAVQYQASVQFLSGNIKSIMTALKGE